MIAPRGRIVLDKDAFRALVAGREVTIAHPDGDTVIILADIGYPVMLLAISDAMHGKGRGGPVGPTASPSA